MRRAVGVVVPVLFIAAVWFAAVPVGGEEAEGPVLAKPRNTAPPTAPPTAPKEPRTAPKDSPPPLQTPGTAEKRPLPAEPAKMPPAKDAAAAKEPVLNPPDQLPDVEIPPIPEVGKDPFSPGPRPVRPKPPDVIEEGKRIFNREGRIETDQIGRSIYVFDSGDKPMWLLECSGREYLEKVTDYGKKRARWRVSGIVTVYGGRNYLFVTKVVPMAGEEEGL